MSWVLGREPAVWRVVLVCSLAVVGYAHFCQTPAGLLKSPMKAAESPPLASSGSACRAPLSLLHRPAALVVKAVLSVMRNLPDHAGESPCLRAFFASLGWGLVGG